AARIDEARLRLTALGAERRRRATARIEELANALETGETPRDGELAALAARLESARSVPGRARRTRVLDVLRKAASWPEAPAAAAGARAGRVGSLADAVREAGRNVVRAMPAGTDPAARRRVLDTLALYGLLFRVGDDGVPLASDREIEKLLSIVHEAIPLER